MISVIMNDEVPLSLFKMLVRGEDDFHFSPDSIMSVAGTCRWVGQRLSDNGRPAAKCKTFSSGSDSQWLGNALCWRMKWSKRRLMMVSYFYSVFTVQDNLFSSSALSVYYFFIMFGILMTAPSTLLYLYNDNYIRSHSNSHFIALTRHVFWA